MKAISFAECTLCSAGPLALQGLTVHPSAKPTSTLPHYFISILTPTDTFVTVCLPCAGIDWAIPGLLLGPF